MWTKTVDGSSETLRGPDCSTGGGLLLLALSSPEAGQNRQFVLNLIHWLDGLLN